MAAKVPISAYDKDIYLEDAYAKYESNIAAYRKVNGGKPLTFAEKLLASHLDNPNEAMVKGGYVNLRPDRVAMQDATGQMAILQFMSSGMKRVAVPSTVHADHLIKGENGCAADLPVAENTNKEVYAFLRGASNKYGIGFWKPGSGIIHQIVLENYAFPGGMMIGTDSHTPNAGGLSMFAVGGGGADAVDVMAGLPLELQTPKVLGIHLTGQLNGWVAPKDVILSLAGKLTVSGGTGYVIEYFGPGCETLSATGAATICNMGAELGATTSVFPFTKRQAEYLRATRRGGIAALAEKNAAMLRADKDDSSIYDKVVELDLSSLEININGPLSPDRNHLMANMAKDCEANNWPLEIKVGLIGSCTNSSYEDFSRAADVCKQALAHGMKMKSHFYISPGSEQIRATMVRDGFAKLFEEVGGIILANACGPCIGQWNRKDMKSGLNTIVHSYNRNFIGRADGNKETMAFVASAEVVTALALAGTMKFNPATDEIEGPNGKWKITAPVRTDLPAAGFDAGANVYEAPAENGENLDVPIAATSDRLQKLVPFPAWDGKDLLDMPILIKVQGKCTTDHISAAGPWLKYRGHLDNIANNLLITAKNAETGALDCVRNQLTGKDDHVPAVARYYKANNVRWVVIGDTNYGEGSSREHAALEPRHLGGAAIIVKSFARIHESNLKKQGVLPLTFVNAADYDKITGNDHVSLVDIAATIGTGKPIKMIVKPASGAPQFEVALHCSMNESQAQWFRQGSALNVMAMH
eukprot:TRINITY_DN17958_c0_g1_i1.p1 TRINITY_DN17958_c0_g1~~TRINITY_DN17958_c0_g1_i1.p1  ORF type:complete len:786 (-),score=228.22 TRINITY_DN17958_c0_g1_i1:101-2365(-)